MKMYYRWSSQICKGMFIITKFCLGFLWPHFEKQDRRFLDGHQVVLHILRLFLINRKWIIFMIDTFNRNMCPL